MRVIALLSYYEEIPSWLAECTASVAKLCDHIIAVDGPYIHFPGALKKPASGTEQAETIARTAAGLGIGCTIHAPRRPWSGASGGEIAKRNFMFQLGKTFAGPDDWFLRIDADEVLTEAWGAREALESSEHDVAEITIWEREVNDHNAELVDSNNDYASPFRCLFRNRDGLRIEQTHYTVIHGEHTVLNGLNQVPAEQLWDTRLEHRTHQRPMGRQRLKATYSSMINDFERVTDVPRTT